MYALHVAATFDSQTRHTGICPQTRDLFIQRHQRKDVLNSLLNGQVGILKRVLIPGWFPCSVPDHYCRRYDRHQHAKSESAENKGPIALYGQLGFYTLI